MISRVIALQPVSPSHAPLSSCCRTGDCPDRPRQHTARAAQAITRARLADFAGTRSTRHQANHRLSPLSRSRKRSSLGSFGQVLPAARQVRGEALQGGRELGVLDLPQRMAHLILGRQPDGGEELPNVSPGTNLRPWASRPAGRPTNQSSS